jgi:hypothetical protein
MKLSQKRTCFGCKALYGTGVIGLCNLGYETGAMIDAPKETVPVEPCPKPMTKNDIYIAKIELRKGSILGHWLTEEQRRVI